MVKRWMWLGWLAGCSPARDGLVGDWTITLGCEEAFDAVGSCPAEFTALLQIWKPDDARAGTADGAHRTLFPGFVDGDGSYSGVGGPAVTSWVGGDLVLELMANSDDPLASEADLDAWATHRLLVSGRPAERCWAATWTWIASDGSVAAEGAALAEHRFRDCQQGP